MLPSPDCVVDCSSSEVGFSIVLHVISNRVEPEEPDIIKDTENNQVQSKACFRNNTLGPSDAYVN